MVSGWLPPASNPGLSFGRIAAVACVILWYVSPMVAPARAGVVAVQSIDIPLRAGDVVLSHGHGLWSRLFAQLNRRDQRFSHAGILILDAQRQWRVVHAEVDDRTGSGRVRIDACAARAAMIAA
jgi:hypothetical protein